MKPISRNRISNIQRNSSIELLRIITMIGVIFLHYNNGNVGGGFRYVAPGSINQYYLLLTENIFICAVDLFIMISAYFLSDTQNRKVIKIVELFVQLSLFRLFFYGLDVALNKVNFSVVSMLYNMIPLHYYVVLYSVLYIISPYINLIINSLDKKQMKKFIIMMFAIFSIWSFGVDVMYHISAISFNQLSPIGIRGSQEGYTIVNFTLVYLIGAYIRKNEINISSKISFISLIIVITLLYGMSIIAHKIEWTDELFWNYNNPLVVIVATLVLLLFLNFKIESEIVNQLAKGTFTCFVCHSMIMKFLDIENVVNANLVLLILHQFCSAIIIYMVSYVIYILYRICTSWFFDRITPICNKINISIDNKNRNEL